MATSKQRELEQARRRNPELSGEHHASKPVPTNVEITATFKPKSYFRLYWSLVAAVIIVTFIVALSYFTILLHTSQKGKSTEWINQKPSMKLLTLIKYTDPDEGTTKKFNFLKVIQGDCMYFAVVLGIDEDTLMIFDKTGPREADDCKYILEEWMEREGGDYEVTWAGLLEALNDAALVRVRRNLKTALTLHFSN